MIRIREEKLHDIHAIREVNLKAFGQSQEANIVDKLRKTCDDLLSLVAIVNKRTVGHILFSILVLDGSAMRDISGVAVYRPEFSEAI
jgi:putative acetyltransferase